jgi:hypothetical protein
MHYNKNDGGGGDGGYEDEDGNQYIDFNSLPADQQQYFLQG